MGVTIHYSGVLRSPQLIQPITKEIEDICNSMNWTCKNIDGTFPLAPNSFKNEKGESLNEVFLEGVFFTPPECETFYFTFTPEGRVVSFVKFVIAIGEENELMGEVIHTKTQFANTQLHMVVIKLLKYLSEKYFKTFEVEDETKYWETGNEEELRRLFELNLQKINEFKQALLEREKEVMVEDTEGLVAKIEEIFRKLNRPKTSEGED